MVIENTCGVLYSTGHLFSYRACGKCVSCTISSKNRCRVLYGKIAQKIAFLGRIFLLAIFEHRVYNKLVKQKTASPTGQEGI